MILFVNGFFLLLHLHEQIHLVALRGQKPIGRLVAFGYHVAHHEAGSHNPADKAGEHPGPRGFAGEHVGGVDDFVHLLGFKIACNVRLVSASKSRLITIV